MHKIKINFKFKFNKQLWVRVAIIVTLVILIITTIRLVTKDKHNTKSDQTPVLTVASTDHPSNTQPAAVSKSTNVQDISQLNPFVDSTLLKQQKQASVQNQSSNMNIGLSDLPAIPSGQPRPNIGSIPIPTSPVPTISNGIPSTSVRSAAAPKIQGVLIGHGGKNQAVMSDGTVVSEGDHYQDGRIAYIGGSGITFDSGREIKYQ